MTKPSESDMERATKWLDDNDQQCGCDMCTQSLADVITQIRADERERCAKIAEQYFNGRSPYVSSIILSTGIAKAIRGTP